MFLAYIVLFRHIEGGAWFPDVISPPKKKDNSKRQV